MDPITRFQMERGWFVDVPWLTTDELIERVVEARQNNALLPVKTIYGQLWFIDPRKLIAVRDLTTEPKQLADAWESVRYMKESS